MDNFKKYIPAIEKEIKAVISQKLRGYEELQNMISYAFGFRDKKGHPINKPKFRGKRFRPSLCLWICELISGEYKKAISIAAAIEIYHNFSLVHDDIEDGDEYRRWRETSWRIFGIPQAINMGSTVLVLSQIALARAEQAGISKNKIMELFKILNTAYIKVAEGQYLDLSFEQRHDVTTKEYLEMIKGKTAALVCVACEAGARMATSRQSIIKYFRDFGLSFGMAYQVYDDIRSIWGEMGKTGKQEGGDIRKKKKTLPIIYALKELSHQDRANILNIYKKYTLSDKDVKKVISLLNKVDAYEYTKAVAISYKNKSLARLNNLKINADKKRQLREKLDFLIPLS